MQLLKLKNTSETDFIWFTVKNSYIHILVQNVMKIFNVKDFKITFICCIVGCTDHFSNCINGVF